MPSRIKYFGENRLSQTLTLLKGEFDKKVDKETGKSLSTNDFTNTYKNQLDNLGTSSTKDYTDTVEEGSNDLPTSNAVYNAINIAKIIKDDSTEIDYKLGVNNGLLYIETVEDGGDTNE